MIKKLIVVSALFIQTFIGFADEGMWILSLLKKQEAAMKAKGLTLTADEIYSINQASLKDAIVWFNGGCTGEIISKEGLVLTNHHCGYDAIAALSTSKDNILDNGFYAATKAEERKPKGAMFVAILQSIEDVTDNVLAELKSTNNETERANKLRELGNQYKKDKAANNPFLDVRLYEMFKGNQYFVFVYEKFTDIRLVGTPPQNVGKFGGDTDNWMWPRHTGDFSLFRIYANKDNQPAAYSPENVPYKPKHHLPVSLKGVKENDYAMIIGFPGRTNRYEFADAVKLAIDETNLSIVDMRAIRLTEWRKVMDKDVDTRLSLSGLYARIANYWKYFIGQNEQLIRLDVVGSKLNEERQFQVWANANKKEYATILTEVATSVAAFKPYAKHLYYINEGVLTPRIMQLSRFIYAANNEFKDNKAEAAANTLKALSEQIETGDWNPLFWEADQKIFARIVYKYHMDIPLDQQPAIVKQIAKKYKFATLGEAAAHKFTADFYKASNLSSQAKARSFVSKVNAKNIGKESSLAFYTAFITTFENVIRPSYINYMTSLSTLGRTYVKGLMEMQQDRNFYADANSSIRLTYGTVRGYDAQDAIRFHHVTTMEGVLDKYVPGDLEFDLSPRFLELAKSRNYGRYAENGKLYVNFLTDNDITGGNSGSPVMNGQGHLIGLAFDGNWEAMSGDIYYDDTYKRTINVDVRYVLWCIEVLGQAPHIVRELTIVE
jgi:V8-like Glu-specific endopeptidase